MNAFKILDRKGKRNAVKLTACHVIGAMLESAGIALIFPLVTHFMAEDADRAYLLRASLGIVLLFLFKNLFLYYLEIKQRSFIMNGFAITSRRLLGAYLKKPYAFFFKENSGTLVSNVIIYTGKVYGYLQEVMELIGEIAVALALFILMLTLSPLLAVGTTFVLGLAAVLIRRVLGRRAKEKQKEANRGYDRMMKTVSQSLSGVETVKAMRCEEDIYREYARSADEYAAKTVRVAAYQRAPRRLMETLTAAGVVSLMLLSQNSAGRDVLYGQFAVLAVIVVRMVPGMTHISSLLTGMAANKAMLERDEGGFAGLLEESAEREPAWSESAPAEFNEAIELKNVSFAYRDKEPVLENVNLKIPKGQTVGLKGPSGAGKSTLLGLLLGLLAPTSGEILVDGKPLASLEAGWGRAVGYIPQNIYMLDKSVKDNVLFYRPYDPEKLRRALRLSHADEFVDKLPDGADTLIGEKGICLSGGQVQRLGIARALYDDPQVLILDEATSSLDTALEEDIMADVFAIGAGKTVIISAHRLSTLSRCEKICAVDNRRFS